jgi:hypothetical protein
VTSQIIILPSNKKFGYFFTFVFLVAAIFCFTKTLHPWGIFFVISASVILSATLIKAEILLPFNKLWMQLGVFLGMIVSPIILGIIFFLIFTPIGFAMRLFGRDELRLRFKKNASSFWISRDSISLNDSFKNQF